MEYGLRTMSRGYLEHLQIIAHCRGCVETACAIERELKQRTYKPFFNGKYPLATNKPLIL